jgi:hypothetical protein
MPTPEQRTHYATIVLKNRKIRDLENTVSNLQQENSALQRRLAQWVEAFGEDGVEIVNGLKQMGDELAQISLHHEAEDSAAMAMADLDELVIWGEDYTTGTGQKLRVHAADACEGAYCVIHRRKPGPQADWPTSWRGQWGGMELLCPHGVGHPAPEQLARPGFADIHTCDGCCRVYNS